MNCLAFNQSFRGTDPACILIAILLNFVVCKGRFVQPKNSEYRDHKEQVRAGNEMGGSCRYKVLLAYATVSLTTSTFQRSLQIP